MNTNHFSASTLFQDRNLDAATFQPRPTRFTTESEGEGMEVFLRGLLVACLLAAVTICGGSFGHASQTRAALPANCSACVATPAPAPLIAAR